MPDVVEMPIMLNQQALYSCHPLHFNGAVNVSVVKLSICRRKGNTSEKNQIHPHKCLHLYG